mgnify:CR=1 FL=1
MITSSLVLQVLVYILLIMKSDRWQLRFNIILHIALIISILTLLHHFFYIKMINLCLMFVWWSNHQVIPIVIWVRYRIKVTILIKILRINRRCILLKLVTPCHWTIFNICIFSCLYLLFRWLHSYAHVCAVCH